jgi:thiamine pyrophosphokinase
LHVIVFANGGLTVTSEVLSTIHCADLIIAADGGADYCLELGVTPQVVIGDLDSLTPSKLDTLIEIGSEIVRHPTRKDSTDLELALEHALLTGADEISILGALGKRWDQTLANLILPAKDSFSHVQIRLIDGHQELFLIQPGQVAKIKGQAGDIVSLVPLLGDTGGVTTGGLEYPLENEVLKFGSTRGISNVLLSENGSVFFVRGSVDGNSNSPFNR